MASYDELIAHVLDSAHSAASSACWQRGSDSRGQSQPRALLQKREESREIHRMRISVRIDFQCFSVYYFRVIFSGGAFRPTDTTCIENDTLSGRYETALRSFSGRGPLG